MNARYVLVSALAGISIACSSGVSAPGDGGGGGLGLGLRDSGSDRSRRTGARRRTTAASAPATRASFTAKAGKANIGGAFSFSVCTAANCVMEKVDLEVTVDVKERGA